MTDPITGLSLWLDRLALRSKLGPDEQDAILSLRGEEEWVKGNREFVRLGDKVDRSCLILSGLAGRFGQARSGERLTSALHIPGDMADLHSAVLPTAASALQSMGGTQIYRIPHVAIMDLAVRFPALAQAFWRDCTVDGAILAQWSLTNTRQQALGRVAHLLAELGVRFGVAGGGHRIEYDFPLTQIQIGDATSLTAVHVNRMVRQLKESGIAEVANRRVRITDWKKLCAVGEFDPTYLHLHQAD
jgi:CRP-like cAMP-binding protein